jgi:hypothetical protein
LLFQTGYLTIEEKLFDPLGGVEYKLSYPNEEVRRALTNSILNALVGSTSEKVKNQRSLREIIQRNDFSGLQDLFHSFFSSIPYDWYRKNQLSGYEGYYASIFYTYFTSSGFEVRAEDTTSKGKIDMTVFFRDRVYIFEFKVVSSSGRGKGGKTKKGKKTEPAGKESVSALSQIKERRYWEKYKEKAKEIYIIGVEFEPEKRNIVGFEWERVK